MESLFECYTHHGKKVWVDRKFKGTHRKNCLCFKCKKFKTERVKNCKIANALYAIDAAFNLVTPVCECPKFKEII